MEIEFDNIKPEYDYDRNKVICINSGDLYKNLMNETRKIDPLFGLGESGIEIIKINSGSSAKHMEEVIYNYNTEMPQLIPLMSVTEICGEKSILELLEEISKKA